MSSVKTPSDVQNIRTLLMREHTQLDTLFEQLLAAVAADATEQAAKLWAEFDQRLLGHLELEEQHILPSFQGAHPTEATRIRAEHGEIRSALLKLGVGVDLHLSRADMIDHFVSLLREHAQREDELMYAWSEQHLEPLARAPVLERMVGRLKVMPAR